MQTHRSCRVFFLIGRMRENQGERTFKNRVCRVMELWPPWNKYVPEHLWFPHFRLKMDKCTDRFDCQKKKAYALKMYAAICAWTVVIICIASIAAIGFKEQCNKRVHGKHDDQPLLLHTFWQCMHNYIEIMTLNHYVEHIYGARFSSSSFGDAIALVFHSLVISSFIEVFFSFWFCFVLFWSASAYALLKNKIKRAM